jgi:hemerythrin
MLFKEEIFMRWKEEYTCFNEEIDRQHQKLFEILSRLYDIVRLKDHFDHYDEIMAIFSELGQYTVYHFGYEEKLFDELKYDSINKKLHKLEHENFIKKVNEVDVNQVDENQRGISVDLVMFVANWVEEHILQTDKKFGMFLKNMRA